MGSHSSNLLTQCKAVCEARPGCSVFYPTCLEKPVGIELHTSSGQLASIFVCIMRTLFLELSWCLSYFVLYLLLSNSDMRCCEDPGCVSWIITDMGRLLLGELKAISSEVEKAASRVAFHLPHDCLNALQFVHIFSCFGPQVGAVL